MTELVGNSLKYLSLLASMLVICGVIHLHTYYGYFSIPIWSFISVKEVLTFFIEDIMVWMTTLLLIFIMIYSIRKSSFYEEIMIDHENGNVSAPSLIGKNWLYIIFIPVQIFLVVYLFSFIRKIASTEYATMFRLLVSLVSLMMSVFVVSGALKKKLNKDILYVTMGLLFILGLVEYSVDKAKRTELGIRTKNIRVSLKDNSNSDDYIFIGKTDKYLFLKKSEDVIILSTDEVVSYEVKKNKSIYRY